MSRIGKQPIGVPDKVQVALSDGLVRVTGPKGQLERQVHPDVAIEIKDNVISVNRKNPDVGKSNFHGLMRSLVNNMVLGVSQGFEKSLSLVGVGYRAAVKGKELHLTLGYSHPVIHPIADGIDIKVEKQTTVVVSGADKELVGQTAADIRAYRRPEPYHGKGVRYSDEVIKTKVGKASGKK